MLAWLPFQKCSSRSKFLNVVFRSDHTQTPYHGVPPLLTAIFILAPSRRS